MWFSESAGHALGAWLGAGAGLAGGVMGCMVGRFAPRGKLKRPVLFLLAVLVTMGAVGLGVGLYALLAGQPFHVWYPFVLIGVILTGVYVPLRRVVKVAYGRAELQKLALKDLG
ncbi:MAG TPA: hypothetical protein DCM14_05720 [Clostridiales bacterium UBA8153]|nr:hypothetical protein [Clostridiales bacterium UBA8153]